MMSRTRPLLFAIFLVLVLTTLTFLYHEYLGNMELSLRSTPANNNSGFVVNTLGCNIPDMDPFDMTVKKFITVPEFVHCNTTPSITYIDGAYLRINRTVLKDYFKEELDFCEYQVISRPDTNSDNVYEYSKNLTVVREDILMKDEFIRIACYGISGSMLSSNFHAFIVKKNEVEQRCKKNLNRQKRTKEFFNILVIGVDSISRLNFIRHLPQTRKFLLEELEGIELMGYNKVADNTYVNLAPMFAGKFVDELPWDESLSYKPFDEFGFIWKNFSENGYRTLYAEDAPTIAIFNYAKEGFHKAPADYYLRPWSLALEEHGSMWRHGRDCVGDKLETEQVLDYVERFVDTFKSRRHFAFSFITRLTHDNINKAGLADAPYLEFFKRIQKSGSIKDTFILFYSDHGMRFGGIRETYIGKLEERLPFIYLIFPKWFRERYPEHVKNLKTNRKRLTTPFDIYETLKDILHFDGTIRNAKVSDRGMSLFSEIPPERTCNNAGILPHWCTCHKQNYISTENEQIIQAAESLVNHINRATEDSKGLCAHLYLDRVTDARVMIANENVLSFRNSFNDVLGRRVEYGGRTEPINTYLITIRVQPGNGVFEATVGKSVEDMNFRIYGDVSRINAYNDKASCMKTHKLRKFCFCL